MKSDKLPQVMSLESASVAADDYKFEKLWGCGAERSLKK